MRNWYSFSEACETLHISMGELLTLITDRQIHPIQIAAQTVIEHNELARYVRDHKTDTLGRRIIREG